MHVGQTRDNVIVLTGLLGTVFGGRNQIGTSGYNDKDSHHDTVLCST